MDKINQILCPECGELEEHACQEDIPIPVFTPPTDEGLREKIAEGVLNAFYPDNTLHEAKLDGTELLLLNMKCHRAADVSLALLQQVIKRDYVEGFNDAISWAGQLCLEHAYGHTRHIDCVQCVIAKRKELKEQVGGKSDDH